MQTWLYVAIAAGILSIFLIFLSGIAQRRAVGIVLMFISALFASAALGYGLYNAHLETKENLGKPIREIQEGEYEILWIDENTRDGKVYLIAEKIGNQSKSGLRFYSLDPSDTFLENLRKLLENKENMRLRMGKNEGEYIEPHLYPAPPEPLPPKP